MPPKIQPGDRVLLETRASEVYEGNVEFKSPRSIELYNIWCQTTNTVYNSSMTFYCKEVVSISRITDSSSTEGTASESSKCVDNSKKISPSIEGTTSESSNCFDNSKKITLHFDEFKRLGKMTLDFIFIDMFDKRFEDAVNVLSDRESVAVVGLGSTFSRGSGLSLLVMSDFKQIFIFDLFNLVYLKGIANILESTFITKVVHDGAALSDCLLHQHNVDMKFVFDTKIADTIISSQKSSESVQRNLSECLTHYFNFPPSLLGSTIDDISSSTWQKRPVQKTDKVQAARLVVYLLTLRDKLMSEMLKPCTGATEDAYNKYRKLTDGDLLKFRIVGKV